MLKSSDRIQQNISRISHDELAETKQMTAHDILQMGGLNLTENGNNLAINPELLPNPTEALEEMISPRESIFSLETEGRLMNIFGVIELTKKLKKAIFDQARRGGIKDKKRGEVRDVRAQNQSEFAAILLEEQPDLEQNLIEALAKISIGRDVLPERFFSEKSKHLDDRFLAWQDTITQIAQASGIDSLSYKVSKKRQELSQRQEKADGSTRQSYKDRLQKLLKDPRKLERYSGIFFGEHNAKDRTQDIVGQFVETSMIINTIRVLSRIHNPEGHGKEKVDLLENKQRVDQIKTQAELIKQDRTLSEQERQRQLEQLDSQLIQIIVPIANRVAKVISHDQNFSNKPDALSAILAKGEAICAGKTEVLLSIFRFLGIEARSNVVLETLDNKSNHTCLEADLTSDNKLVVDTAYNSHIDFAINGKKLIHSNNQEIVDFVRSSYGHLSQDQIKNIVISYIKYRDNAKVLASSQDYKDSDVLIYRIKCTNKQKDNWDPDIPFPHTSTSADREDIEVSSSYYLNLALPLVNQGEVETAIAFLRKSIEINPELSGSYNELGRILTNQRDYQEAEKYFKMGIGIQPECFSIFLNFGYLRYQQGRYQEAEDYYRKELEYHPDNKVASNNLKLLLREQGRSI